MCVLNTQWCTPIGILPQDTHKNKEVTYGRYLIRNIEHMSCVLHLAQLDSSSFVKLCCDVHFLVGYKRSVSELPARSIREKTEVHTWRSLEDGSIHINNDGWQEYMHDHVVFVALAARNGGIPTNGRLFGMFAGRLTGHHKNGMKMISRKGLEFTSASSLDKENTGMKHF